jgi:hypothetical protein
VRVSCTVVDWGLGPCGFVIFYLLYCSIYDRIFLLNLIELLDSFKKAHYL